MNAIIVRYTHAAHILVDGLLGISMLAYATLSALGEFVPANGAPAHAIIAIIGGLVIASAWLRKASKQLEEIDPSSPVVNNLTANTTPGVAGETNRT